MGETGYWMPDTGYWILDTGYWMSGVESGVIDLKKRVIDAQYFQIRPVLLPGRGYRFNYKQCVIPNEVRNLTDVATYTTFSNFPGTPDLLTSCPLPSSSRPHVDPPVQHSVLRINPPISSNQRRVSNIKHPVSSIQHQASSIKRRVSNIKYPASSIRHQASSILKTTIILIVCLMLSNLPALSQPSPIHVGSKSFTESVILGEIVTQLVRVDGHSVEHRAQLGGTAILWNGLLAGELDIYPDYTGTLIQEVLAGENIDSLDELEAALNRRGIRMTAPLGFNNTYAIGMREERAETLGIESISDLIDHPGLAGGFSNEFMDREDGWPGLRDAYALPHTRVRGLDHDLAYRALESGDIDFTDLYSTDAEIAYYGLRTLDDDRGFFPEYQAVILYREDLDSEIARRLHQLEDRIDEMTMTSLNAQVKLDREQEPAAAARFLNESFQEAPQIEIEEETRLQRIWTYTLEHLWLVLISLGAAILVAIPLGIVAVQNERLGQIILGVVGVIYTIPSLALLVFMIPLLGIGGPPAMVALFLYSLLPIVRNTHTGLSDISRPLHESAEALGLSPMAKLFEIELPLASRSILAGIKTSAIINIGTATLGALIGAGGYGQPILTGIRLDDTSLILEGAVPAALLALVAQLLFDGLEKVVIPKGLRIQGE